MTTMPSSRKGTTMQGYYDTEFQPELTRADVERELAEAARLDQAALH